MIIRFSYTSGKCSYPAPLLGKYHKSPVILTYKAHGQNDPLQYNLIPHILFICMIPEVLKKGICISPIFLYLDPQFKIDLCV